MKAGDYAMAAVIFVITLLGLLLFVFAEPAKAANITRVFNCTGPDCSRLIAKANDYLDMGEGTESKPCVASSGSPATSCTGGSCAFDPSAGTLYFCGDSGSWGPISGGGGSTTPYYSKSPAGFFPWMWATDDDNGGGLQTTAGAMFLLSAGTINLNNNIYGAGNIAIQSAENIQLNTNNVGDGSVVQVAGVLDLQYLNSTWDSTTFFSEAALDPDFGMATIDDFADPEFVDDFLFQLRNTPTVAGLFSWTSTITIEGATGTVVPKLFDVAGTINMDHGSAFAGANYISFTPTINVGSSAGAPLLFANSVVYGAPVTNNEFASPAAVQPGFGTFVDATNWTGADWLSTSRHNSFRTSVQANTDIGRAVGFSCGPITGSGDVLGDHSCMAALDWTGAQLSAHFETGVNLQAGMDIGVKNGSPLVEPPSQPTINGNRPLTIDAAFMLVTNSVAGLNIMSMVAGIDGQYAQIMNKTPNILYFPDSRSGTASGFIAASCGTPNGGTTMCSGGNPTGGGCLLQRWDSIEVRYSAAADSWIQTGCAQIQSGYATYSIADLEVAAE